LLFLQEINDNDKMKANLLKLIACALFIIPGMLHVQAQVVEDTLLIRNGDPVVTPGKGKTQPPQYQEDMVEITQGDLPDALRSTLTDEEYKGWENSTIYHDKRKNRYSLELNREGDKRVYHFDQNGKRIEQEMMKPHY
jgi:hypothetical protein